jgi:hypothetical protein
MTYVTGSDAARLVTLCLQLLLALLEYCPVSTEASGNSWTGLLRRISDPQEIHWMFTGLLRHLKTYLKSVGAILPGSVRTVNCH